MTIHRRNSPRDSRKHDRFSRFGLWRAEVINTDDPQNRGRIQVRVLQLHPAAITPTADTKPGEAKSDVLVVSNASGATPRAGVPKDACPWAEPCVPFGGKKNFNSGHLMVPYVGSTVWVAFEQGYSGRAVWLGSWLGRNELPEEIGTGAKMKDVRLIRTAFGHLLLFDETEGAEKLYLGIAPSTGDRVRFLEFDEAGAAVTLSNEPSGIGSGTRIYMTETQLLVEAGTTKLTLNHNNDVTLETGTNCTLTVTGNVAIDASGNVTIGAGAVQGVCLAPLLTTLSNFMTLYASHTHTITSGSSAGTTTPPITGSPVTPVAGVDSSLTVKAKA